MNNFIITQDIETAKYLKSLNFQEIKNSNGFFTFINNPLTFSFNENDAKRLKIKYTNNLCI